MSVARGLCEGFFGVDSNVDCVGSVEYENETQVLYRTFVVGPLTKHDHRFSKIMVDDQETKPGWIHSSLARIVREGVDGGLKLYIRKTN